MENTVKGWIPDFNQKDFFVGVLEFKEGRISKLRETDGLRSAMPDTKEGLPVILPGLVDAHAHIESSMVVPSEFARQVLSFGTVAVVADPHEIANVMGMEGVHYMIENSKNTGLKYYFTAPSCVPATNLESAGAVLGPEETRELLQLDEIIALGEMMNYPGVIAGDSDVLAKIGHARRLGLPVDGHAPGLSGKRLEDYIKAGITSDHECTTLSEATEKISLGMKIMIREGSAARDFDELAPLISRHPGMVMLCTDDCHPDQLRKGYINDMVLHGLKSGIDIFSLIMAASHTPVKHFNLDVGLLQPGDFADFITVSSLEEFRVTGTWINGKKLFDGEQVSLGPKPVIPVNRFGALPVGTGDIRLEGTTGTYRVIRAVENQLLTECDLQDMQDVDGSIRPDPDRDILKIVVINRYRPAQPAVGLVTGFQLKYGALASSIAHDSHNLIAVGTTDEEIVRAVNELIASRGGISFAGHDNTIVVPLTVAGLMSTGTVANVAERYESINQLVKMAGCGFDSPFMTLSFLSLLVIPHIKIGDHGLFDCDTFQFIPVKAE